jgi:signal peptidase I
MLPTVRPGDTLIVDKANCETVDPGDIVLFGRDRRLFAHRVVAKAGASGNARIVTQGDGMLRPDAPVKGSQVLGKVSLIVRDGKCLEPKPNLTFSERTVAALVRRSSSAARIFVGVHGLRQNSREQVVPCHS